MTNQNEEPAAGYRGSFVYQQEYSYKLITLMVGLRTRHLIERPAGLPLAGRQDKPLSTSPITALPCNDFPGARRTGANSAPEKEESAKKHQGTTANALTRLRRPSSSTQDRPPAGKYNPSRTATPDTPDTLAVYPEQGRTRSGLPLAGRKDNNPHTYIIIPFT